MKIAAIIAEYNPFHNGHAYQIQATRQHTGATHIMVLMSGSFVQRGDFAITDKWLRAQMALLSGADLVCELPYAACGQSAEYFSTGAIRLLGATNSVDLLSFGSESGSCESLLPAATLLAEEPASFCTLLKENLTTGMPYAQARLQALKDLLPSDSHFPDTPNDILGIEYLKALIRTKSPITPFTIQRIGDRYHQSHTESHCYPNASWLREQLYHGRHDLSEYLPACADQLIEQFCHQQQNPYSSFYKSLRHRILLFDLNVFRQYPYFEPGMEFALKKAVGSADDFDAFVSSLTAKHLPAVRIRRYLMNLMCGLTEEDLTQFSQEDDALYLRVLGFNTKGRRILKKIRERSDLPILTNPRSNQTKLSPAARYFFDKDRLTTDLYELYVQNTPVIGRDYTEKPIILPT